MWGKHPIPTVPAAGILHKHPPLGKTRYGMERLSPEVPIHLLGKGFRMGDQTSNRELKVAVESLPYFTYRKDFAPIEDGKQTSDAGWGCMHRTTQMMWCSVIFTHKFGKPETWDVTDEEYQKTLHHFSDHPEMAFSIHRIVETGKLLGTSAGKWFAPSVAASAVKNLSTSCTEWTRPLTICVTQQSTIVKDTIHQKCYIPIPEEEDKEGGLSKAGWRSLLVLAPVRMGGGNTFNSNYKASLPRYFQIPQFCGMVGGRPSKSFYFVGCQEQTLLYLDPHDHTQKGMTPDRKSTGIVHVSNPKTMSVEDIDPSAMLSFYCRDKEDWESLVVTINLLAEKPNPLLYIQDQEVEIPAGVDGFSSDGEGEEDDDGFEIIDMP